MTALLRFLPLLLLPVALAGCSSRSSQLGSTAGIFNPGVVSSAEARSEGPQIRTNQPALASLPGPAGRIVTVRQRDMADGLTQQIVYAGDAGTRGENRIELTIRNQAAGERYDNLVDLVRPTQAIIDREMEAAFPGMRMTTADYLLRNGYGPYGVATGSNGRMNCVYAWQYVDDLHSPGRKPSILSMPVEASVRVRFCRSGFSREQLLEVVNGLQYGPSTGAEDLLASTGSGDLLDEPRPEAPRAYSRRGRVASFDGYERPPAVAGAKAVQQPAAATRTVRQRPVRATATARPAPVRTAPVQGFMPGQVMPPVPGGLAPQPPGSVGYGMAYGLPQAVPAQGMPPQPAGYPQPYRQPGVAPAGAGGPFGQAAVPRRLDPTLPPQAYRGPVGASQAPNGAARPPLTRPAVSPY